MSENENQTTGVFDNFAHPCLMCGTTVHVVDGQALPHECADLPAGDNLAYAWWQGYDTAKAAVEPKPAVEWLGESVQAQQDDLRAILDALGISTHARPYSPHEVVQREVLPAVAAVERERDALRAEVERLTKANKSLRRQRAKLVNGLLPVSAECPASGGCGNCALCHRDAARAVVRMTEKRVRDAGFRPMPEGLWDALEQASRAEKAEATLARVQALADELGSDATPTSLGRARRSACELIRAALEGGDA